MEPLQRSQVAEASTGGGSGDDGEAIGRLGQTGKEAEGLLEHAAAGEGGDEGVVGDEVAAGHEVEEAEGVGEGEGGEEGVVGVEVLEGEVGEGAEGGGEEAEVGVEVDEAVGEEGVGGEAGLEEAGVEEAGEKGVLSGEAAVEEGEVVVDEGHGWGLEEESIGGWRWRREISDWGLFCLICLMRCFGGLRSIY